MPTGQYNRKPKKLVCEQCGEVFLAKGEAKTCSDACRKAHRAAYFRNRRRKGLDSYDHKMGRLGACRVCGKQFKRKTCERVCGQQCRDILRLAKNDKREAERLYSELTGELTRDAKRRAAHQPKPATPTMCARCGEMFDRPSVERARIYCGDECAAAAKRDAKNLRRRIRWATDPEYRRRHNEAIRLRLDRSEDSREKRRASSRRWMRRFLDRLREDPAAYRMFLAARRERRGKGKLVHAARALEKQLAEKLEQGHDPKRD